MLQPVQWVYVAENIGDIVRFQWFDHQHQKTCQPRPPDSGSSALGMLSVERVTICLMALR